MPELRSLNVTVRRSAWADSVGFERFVDVSVFHRGRCDSLFGLRRVTIVLLLTPREMRGRWFVENLVKGHTTEIAERTQGVLKSTRCFRNEVCRYRTLLRSTR